MSPSKRNKEVKVNLGPDQFSISESGELVIKEEEIVRTIQEQQPGATAGSTAPDAASEVSVGVVVSVSF